MYLGQQVCEVLFWCKRAMHRALVRIHQHCHWRDLSRPISARVIQTSNDNEGDSSKVTRDLKMMFLLQCSLELLLSPPTLIHFHGA